MATIVEIDATRRRPGKHSPKKAYLSCPLTQCDLTVKVCLRRNDGQKTPLAGVAVSLVNSVHTGITDAEGVVQFIGFTPAGGREPITIRAQLGVGERANYAWFNWHAGKMKDGFPWSDEIAKTVSADHQELFYFEAAEKQSLLVVELDRTDNKALSQRVELTVTPNPTAGAIFTTAENTLYRGIRVTACEAKRKSLGRKGTEYHNDRIVIKVNPGRYTVKLADENKVRSDQTDPKHPGRAWNINPPGGVDVHVDVPAADERRVIYTLGSYHQVQFCSLVVGTGPMGNADLAMDLKVRCQLLMKAIEQALPHTDDSESVLKLFMAPEFYFQGPEGRYPLDLIEGVNGDKKKPGMLGQLRKFLADKRFKDWMFVLGTAIGGLKHDATRTPYPLRITNVTGTQVTVAKDPSRKGSDASIGGYILNIAGKQWHLVQKGHRATVTASQALTNGSCRLDVNANPGFRNDKCTLEPPGAAGFHILKVTGIQADPQNILTVVSAYDKTSACQDITPLWTAEQPYAGANLGIKRAERSPATPNAYALHMDGDVAAYHDNELIYLFEPPQRTEVFNVATIVKGGPDPRNPGDVTDTPVHQGGVLHELIVYKEHVSSIDYTAPMARPKWSNPTGTGRRVMFGTTEGTVQPTQGSVDTLGGIENKPSDPGTTEVQSIGLGGGSLFTLDGINFGLEVCLDHAEARLDAIFRPGGGAKPGDSYPQVQLIPSCGMNIGGGVVRVVDNGFIFNVDGGCYEAAVLRHYDGSYSCDDHPAVNNAAPGQCPDPHDAYYYCPQPHNQSRFHPSGHCWCFQYHAVGSPGTCACGRPLTSFLANTGTRWFYCPPHSRGVVHAHGPCWCRQTHSPAAPGECECGKTLVASPHYSCGLPHNLTGAHLDGPCWCGSQHDGGTPGQCLCGQTLAQSGPDFLCPRNHSAMGIHTNSACWCGATHLTATPGNCQCGAPLSLTKCYTCSFHHNQKQVHGEGNNCGVCGNRHVDSARGSCQDCGRPLGSGEVFACPSYWEQAETHSLGRDCVTCSLEHKSAAPGTCTTCGHALVAGQTFYCQRPHALNDWSHREDGSCGCSVRHKAALPGQCGVCNLRLRRAIYYKCACRPGEQFAANCDKCGKPMTARAYYYCPGIHNLKTVYDSAGDCADCSAALLATTFFSCPGLHNQKKLLHIAGNCDTCGRALRATRYYYCGNLHNATDHVHAAGKCSVCLRPLTAVSYYHCQQPHAVRQVIDSLVGGPNCACGAPLTQVEAFHCPGKHSHRDDEDAPGNCGEGTCQTALLDAEDDTLKRIGRFIDPTAVGTWIGNLDETGVKDGAGQITWGRYFKSATREIKVYPVQDLPDGETVP